MLFNQKLLNISRKNKSLLCVGLDLDLKKIPNSLLKEADPLFSFAKAIIDSTSDLVCAYKPNIAFFEMYGVKGLTSLKRIIEYIPKEIPVILDVKRGDIGNTAEAYAISAFEDFKADAVTVSPYMGFDSIEPFLKYADKGVFVLGLTSNKGSADFQKLMVGDEPLYMQVVRKIAEWDKINHNLGVVVGATNPTDFTDIRKVLPTQAFLIPGVGAQGGDLEAAVKLGSDSSGEMAVINSSRAILYASNGSDFAEAARIEAKKTHESMNAFR